MKVLLLVNKGIKNNECCSRSYMYGLLLKEYLEDLDVQVQISNFIYDGRRLNNLNIIKKINYDKDIDHIILINKDGFSKKGLGYVKKLKKIANNTVSSFTYSNRSKRDEDMIFFTEYGVRTAKEGVCLNYFSDPKICFPQKKKGIHILIDDKECKLKDNIIKFAKDSQGYTKIVVKGIRDNLIYDYDMNGDKINVIKISDFFKFYDIFRKIDFYFITDYVKDPMLLSDLSMCNAMVVAKKGIVSKRLIKTFDIFETSDFINWDLIIQKKNTFNIRDKLISDQMINENAFSKIYTYLIMNYAKQEPKEESEAPTVEQKIIRESVIKEPIKKVHIMQGDLLSILG